MHKGFAARQPIFNTRGDVVAYEILYRNSESNCYPVGVSGDVATSSIWVNVFFNINIQKISNGRQIFINIPNTQFLKSIKNKIPDKNVVFEILETFEPNDELFCLVKKMSKRGHIFALDDFIYKEAWDRFLPYIDIIKFDVNDINVKEISQEIKKFKSYGITCLLEKVETKECYKEGVKSGFDLFQGYFFEKPEIISFDLLSYNSRVLDRLMSLSRGDCNKVDFLNLLEKDPSLSYMFMNYINKEQNKVTYQSLKSAVDAISCDDLRVFIVMITGSKLADEAPVELKKLAIQRMYFLENLAKESNYYKQYVNYAKTLGFLSCMDGILNQSMNMVLKDLRIDDIYKEALIYKRTDLYGMLMISHFYENGMWDELERYLLSKGIDVGVVDNIYQDSIYYADLYAKEFE